jgi:hypothetical protein
MAPPSAPDHDAVRSEFKKMLKTCTKTGACGRPYVLVEKLTNWLKSEVKLESGVTATWVDRLLEAAYPDRNYPGSPIESPEQFREGESCSLLVFSILFSIELDHLIDRFEGNISDSQLPITDFNRLRRAFKGMSPSDANRHVQDFDSMQWQFCPAKFTLYSKNDWEAKRVLPISRKEQINDKGGTATLWQIEVHEEFLGQPLRDAVPDSRYDLNDGFGNVSSLSLRSTDLHGCPSFKWSCLLTVAKRYHFALKQFSESNENLFKNEMMAFRALRKHEGMVRCLAKYTHEELDCSTTTLEAGVEERTKNTHNILLEFGEDDLDTFFAGQQPPVLQAEIEKFWMALFEIANAIDGVHNLKDDGPGTSQDFDGCVTTSIFSTLLIVIGGMPTLSRTTS